MTESQNVQSINGLLKRQQEELVESVRAAMADVTQRKAATEYELLLASTKDRLLALEWSWLMQLGTFQPKRIPFGEYLVQEEIVLLEYDSDDDFHTISKALSDSEPLAALLVEHGLDVKHRLENETQPSRWQVYFVRV